MSFIRNLLALIGLLTVIALGVAAVKGKDILSGFDLELKLRYLFLREFFIWLNSTIIL